ncbi:hypothetical protein CP10139811_0518 [Chlamydia ibidis]|uniref:Uncharacterized protein n=2 Tax=Chlamydia ibidis TaxID=1405396 RepID=S7J2J2_9CHLA|nr:DUF1548 domain-containing protein [Chlamydia ibidis]EPP34453.1 hypothetical protein CP10139811_0518 [Chlamydia ibidis]EQM62422.1 hypothetical protein H359_0897 [Chlamydia ibidis 10-1398/6]
MRVDESRNASLDLNISKYAVNYRTGSLGHCIAEVYSSMALSNIFARLSLVLCSLVSCCGTIKICLLLQMVIISLSLALSAVICFLLLPVKLLFLGLSLLCSVNKSEKHLELLQLGKFKNEQNALTWNKSAILNFLLKSEFVTCMSPSALSLAPQGAEFFNCLTNASAETECDFLSLEKCICDLGAWNPGWQKIKDYFSELTSKYDNSHPDRNTLPVFLNSLHIALLDSSIPQDKKRQGLDEISSYSEVCVPTWAESIFRVTHRFYSKGNSAEEQLLIWLQMVKEEILLGKQLSLGESHDWHQINGVKKEYGKQLGLNTVHISENLSSLTLRQTSSLPRYLRDYYTLANRFLKDYSRSRSAIVYFVYSAFLSAEASIQTSIRTYLSEIVARETGLSGASVAEILTECFYNENYELKEEAITYLLYKMGVLLAF